MTGAVFADTAGWLATMSPRFEHHHLALETFTALQQQGTPLVTTNLVVAEMHALLTGRVGVTRALELFDRAYTDPSCRVVHVDVELQHDAVDRWLRVCRDLPFSLCDAVSFEVMRREGLRQAFTLDRHFALAGFEIVPALPEVKPIRAS